MAASNLTLEQLYKLRAESVARMADNDVGQIATAAVERIDAIIKQREGQNKPQTVPTQPPSPTVAQPAQSRPEPPKQANGGTTSPPPNRVGDTGAAQAAPTTHTEIKLEVTNSENTVVLDIDSKKYLVSDVKSRVLTYLTHCAESKSANEGNWSKLLQGQSFANLVFWLQALGKFPLKSGGKFPTQNDVGEHLFKSKVRKIIYLLAEKANAEGISEELIYSATQWVVSQNIGQHE
jgi:hypothetical protein